MKPVVTPSLSSSDSFPAPIPIGDRVDTARRQRLHDIARVTVIGIAVRILVIAAEMVGIWYSNSAVLFVDAVASLFDVVASIVLLAAVHFAAQPPDEGHPFGHGRAEPLAGFQLALLLIVTGIWLGVQNFTVAATSTHVAGIPAWTWLISAGAAVLLLFIAWLVRVTGRRTNSSALASEAVHFQIDALTSLLTTITLLAAAFFPEFGGKLDHLGGGLLALIMIGLGGMAAMGNLHQILDRLPHDDEVRRVRESSLAVDGVIDVEKIRIQQAGPDVHVNIDIEVQPETTVDVAHRIAQKVRARIQLDWPFVREVVVHVEPYYEGDH